MNVGKARNGWLVGAGLLLTAACVPGTVATPGPSPTVEVAEQSATTTPTASATSTETAEPSPTPEPTHPAASRPFEPLHPGQMPVLRSIHMQTGLEGWAVGLADEDPFAQGHVLWTEDGGLTWIDVSPPEHWLATEPFEPLLDAASFERDRAWVLYYGKDQVWQINPNPTSWERAGVGVPWAPGSTITSAGPEHSWLLQSVEAAMGTELVALYRTSDGGISWNQIVDPYDESDLQICFKTGISFSNPERGWVTVDCQGNYAEAFVLMSTDGGESWVQQVLPVPPDGPRSPEEGYCYSESPFTKTDMLVVRCLKVVEEDLTESTYLYFSEDREKSWRIREYPGGQLQLMDDGTILALGQDQYRSTDSGTTWAKIKSVEWEGLYSFVDPDTGWAVATSGNEIALVRTTNGGSTWEIIEPVIGSN